MYFRGSKVIVVNINLLINIYLFNFCLITDKVFYFQWSTLDHFVATTVDVYKVG